MESRGGVRQGAGRKSDPNKKITIGIRVTPEMDAIIERMAEERKISKSRMAKILIIEGLKITEN